MFSLANFFRLFLTLVVVAFVFAVYFSLPGAVGEPRMQVSAASGGPVDALIDDGAGTFVFSPEECRGFIGSLTRCTSTIEISNVGQTASDGVEFEYWIEAWADEDGADVGDTGSRGDALSPCFTVALTGGSATSTVGAGASAGPWVGTVLQVGQAQAWTVSLQVRGENECQGASTTAIVAVFASNDTAVFDELRTPTPTATPEATETPEPEPTEEPAEPTEEPEEPVVDPPPPVAPTTAPVIPTLDPGDSPVVVVTPPPTVTASPTAVATPTATEPPPPPPDEPPAEEEPEVHLDGLGVPRVGETNFLTNRIPGGISALSRDPAVIATNVGYSLAAVLIILGATTIFNGTLKENGARIDAMTKRFLRPVTGVGRALGLAQPAVPKASDGIVRGIKHLVIILATGGIYAMMEPSFGWNEKTLVLAVAMIAGIAMTTFLFEGGQVLWTQKRYRSEAAMRIYPIAILVAVSSVLLTRVADLHPGIIFGFVAAAAVGGRTNISRSQHGMIVLIPVLGLMAVAVISFLLIEPLRAYAEAHPSVWGSMPETIAVALFVCGAQGTLMVLVPVTFNDGEKIWQWNKFVWLAVALPAAFMFFHVMVNHEGDFGDTTQGSGALTILVVSVGILAASILVWLYFRLTGGRYRHA